VSALAGPWRLIAEGGASGVSNMAEDVAILQGDGPLPALRLYTWEVPTLSLGYSQDADAVVDFERADGLGVPVVRRPTGGGAVLHDGSLEVTYSVVADEAGLPASVVDAYRLIASALVAALSVLGIEAELAPSVVAAADRSAVCFESASRYELVVGGRKTVGSAQCRRGGRVLQHGAVPLRLDPARAVATMRSDDHARLAARLTRHAAGLEEVAGRSLSAEAVRAALVAGFERALGARFAPAGLTPDEEAVRARLVALGLFGPLRPGGERPARLPLEAGGSEGA
jgi:lipoyl(octanoyl) transferase